MSLMAAMGRPQLATGPQKCYKNEGRKKRNSEDGAMDSGNFCCLRRQRELCGSPLEGPQAGRQAGRCGVVQVLADESAVLTGETPNRREQALHQGPC